MPPTRTYTREDLMNLQPRHTHFVGIDSDGCVFPTMEIKQKRCFHKLIVSHWELGAIEGAVRETAEFVNLYSKWRGQNRFTALIKTFDLLRERKDAQASGVVIPELASLRELIASGVPLGNPQLAEAFRKSGNLELASVLRWSKDVNVTIARTVRSVPPFKGVVESLERIRPHCDAICVSQTPAETLSREWEQQGLLQYLAAVAGQELGTKADHLTLAARGKYAPNRVLMIGDALGDLAAARATQALFFPINPGREEAAWERFHKEAFDKFLSGTYADPYQDTLIAEFEALMPETPPWQK